MKTLYSSEELENVTSRVLKTVTDRLNILMPTPTALTQNNTVEKRVKSFIATETFEDILAECHEKLNTVKFLQHVAVDEQVREKSREMSQKIENYFIDLYLREDLYTYLKQDIASTEEQKRLQEIILKRFESKGVGKPQAQELLQQIVKLELQFQKNVNEDTSTLELKENELSGVPISLLNRIKSDDSTGTGNNTGTKYSLQLNNSIDVCEILDHCSDRETRYKVKSASDSICPENINILEQLIGLRNIFANLLGHEKWTDYAVKNQMLGTTKNVRSLLDNLYTSLHEPVSKYLKNLQSVLPYSLEPHDIRYAKTLYNKKHFDLDKELIRQYFPFDTVLRAMLDLYSSILSLTFKEVYNREVWHNSVRTFEVYDKTNALNPIGVYYCDLFPRKGKLTHAGMAFNLNFGGQRLDGTKLLPCAALLCNLSDNPSLLTLYDVETLFHEFGHVLHIICSGYKAKYIDLTFETVDIDFVETPSQFVEFWIYIDEVLNKITAGKLPKSCRDMIIKCRSTGSEVYEYLRTTCLADLDQQMYGVGYQGVEENSTSPKQQHMSHEQQHMSHEQLHVCVKETDGKVTRQVKVMHLKDVFDQQMSKYFTMPFSTFGFLAHWTHPGDAMYAGIYYSYMQSLILAMNIYEQFFTSGNPLNQKLGLQYRKIILEPGASKKSSELLHDFCPSLSVDSMSALRMYFIPDL
jgi:thimet oligopeptidase